jgi:hypothetical protein
MRFLTKLYFELKEKQIVLIFKNYIEANLLITKRRIYLTFYIKNSWSYKNDVDNLGKRKMKVRNKLDCLGRRATNWFIRLIRIEFIFILTRPWY